MRLVQLSSDRESFNSIKFNDKGITLIVGKQKLPHDNDNGRTYNGVGKSLIVYLIHFCLGANTNASLTKSLPNWTFYLTIFANGQEYMLSRSTSNQSKPKVNEVEYSLKDLREFLLGLTTALETKEESITFRGLVKRFLRPSKSSYSDYDIADNKETDYVRQLYKCFLMGLDVSIATKKRNLKAELDYSKKRKSSLEKDEIFKQYFTAGRDPNIRLAELSEEIAARTSSFRDFKIAENYHELRKKADNIQSDLVALRNRRYLLEQQLNSINRSLQEQPDIQKDRVTQLFEQAKIVLTPESIRHIDAVQEFHSNLLANRKQRLEKQKNSVSREIKTVDESTDANSRTHTTLIKFLNKHGAVDQYIEIQNYIRDLEEQKRKITDYLSLIATTNQEIHEKEIELKKVDMLAYSYLERNKEITERNNNTFRVIGKRFYPDKPLGLTFAVNEGENQNQFSINAKIESDLSDGINEVKIFTYDMTLLLQQSGHCFGFIMHDSRLFSDIDPRQRSTLFKVAQEYCSASNYQYIASVNQEQIEEAGFKRWFEEGEYKSIISDNIVKELTDMSDQEKLLGVQVNLDYS